MDDYIDFHRQYVCIVRQMRTKPGPSTAEALRLTFALMDLMSAHPDTWTKRAEDWLASE